MLPQPTRFAGIFIAFAPFFVHRSWKQAQALLISNQVSKGFEQLGSKDLVVRLGGIYALEGVMNTSEEYHKPAVCCTDRAVGVQGWLA